MRLFLAGLILLLGTNSWATPCDGFFALSAFSPASLKTNSESVFDPAQLRGKNAHKDHLSEYADPLDGFLKSALGYVEDSKKFRSLLLEQYGFKDSDFRFSPLFKRGIEKFRIQKHRLLIALRNEQELRKAEERLTYEWVISVTVRVGTQLDIFPLRNSIDQSVPVTAASKSFRKQMLKGVLMERLMGEFDIFEFEELYQDVIEPEENRSAFYKIAVSYFPNQLAMPYIGVLSEEDIGNGAIQGVHYINISFGQTYAHTTYYTTDDFMRHDMSHMFHVAEDTSQNEDRMDLNIGLRRMNAYLREYVKTQSPSESDVRELQKFLYLRIREQSQTIDSYLGAYSRGDMSRMGVESYLQKYREEFPGSNTDNNLEALNRYFKWLQPAQPSASDSARRS